MNSETLELEWRNQLFDIRRSVRYHQRRSAFFLLLNRLTVGILLAFGGLAAYGAFFSEAALVMVLAANALVVCVMAVILNAPAKKDFHAAFARQYMALELRLSQAQCQSELILHELLAWRMSLEAEEPPVLHVLNVMCHNETMRAMGYKKEQWAPVKWWQRLFAHIVDIREDLLFS